MSGTMVLVRHGQSEWNLKNLFTGWRDPDLTEQGFAEAHEAGKVLREEGLSFDIAFTSVLQRAETEIRAQDSRSLEEVVESLERTLNMFRGVVTKTRMG